MCSCTSGVRPLVTIEIEVTLMQWASTGKEDLGRHERVLNNTGDEEDKGPEMRF